VQFVLTRNKFHVYGKDIFSQRGLKTLRFRENNK